MTAWRWRRVGRHDRRRWAAHRNRSLTGTTANRRLRAAGRFFHAASKAVRAGDRFHHHARTWHKQEIERFTDRHLIVHQSIYLGDPQCRSFARPSDPQNPHIGSVGQTSKPAEFARRWSNSGNAHLKIRTRRIGLCKFVWMWHDSHALSIRRPEQCSQATNL